MAYFYEIRGSTNAVLKRDGGFASRYPAKIAAREYARRMENSRQPDKPDVERIMKGRKGEKCTHF
jgi:hypothetical protein